MAIAELTINDKEFNSKDMFVASRIPLEPENVVEGWNTVQLKYMAPYNKNRVGLHSYIEAADN